MWPGSTASRPCGGKTRFEARATDTGGLGTAAASKAKVTQLTTGARCRASKAQPVFPATGTTGVPQGQPPAPSARRSATQSAQRALRCANTT